MGALPAPPPVDSTTVSGTLSGGTLTVNGEILHFTHTHNVPLQRNIQYVTEIDTSPSFTNAHPISVSTSRSGFVHLPTKDSTGTQHTYYLRVTPQLFGSEPGKPTVYGGLQGPTPIQMTGSSQVDILPTQSGGTAKPGQGGLGLGPTVYRSPVGGPKRQVT